MHPFKLVLKTSPSLFCAALSIFVLPFSDGLVLLLFLREDWQVLTMYLAPWRDLPTHAIHRHFVANPVRHDKAPNRPFVFGTRIGNPSHHSEIFSFRRALWTVNCSTGVKWCLAPDCCCSHCHVCRLLCCSQPHPSSKRHWKRGKQSEGRFMILLGQRKHCWEGVGSLSVLNLSWCPQTVAVCLFLDTFAYKCCFPAMDMCVSGLSSVSVEGQQRNMIPFYQVNGNIKANRF